LNDPNFDIFYGAPALIVISTVTQIPWAIEDSALAAENLMLAARGMGLGTCWIGFAQAWLGTPEGKAALNAKGGGPVSEELKTRPADLTALAKNNNGVFPYDRVYQMIDGRNTTVASHGIRGDASMGIPIRTSPSI